VIGGKKKYINIFGSFTEPFNCKQSCHLFDRHMHSVHMLI